MTSDEYKDQTKPGQAEGKAKWPIAGGRCHPDDLHLIDRAALHLRMKRAHFVVETAVERARLVLGEAA